MQTKSVTQNLNTQIPHHNKANNTAHNQTTKENSCKYEKQERPYYVKCPTLEQKYINKLKATLTTIF